jgi:cell division protein FtsW
MRMVRHPGELRWETRLLAAVVTTLVVFGIIAVYGASSLITDHGRRLGPDYALTQLTGAAFGGVLLIIASHIDYFRWRDFAWPLLLLTILLLLIPVLPFTEMIAPERNGARRWLLVGPAQFQPSELARLAVVIWCAMLAAKKGERVREFRKGVLPFVTVLGLIFGLILLQPNLSMAVLVTMLGGVVLFASGAKIGHFLILLMVGVTVAYNAVQGAQYRLARVLTFLGPGDSTAGAFQVSQSVIGFASGRLFGVGLGEGQQKLGYLPYAYSDFLFSSIGEEWGFIGVCVLVALYVTFCWLGFRIARTASDPFGRYLAVGLTVTVGLTAFMHMAVNLDMMPTTGLTLPFVSHGRSSLVISLLGAGILINIGRMRGKPGRHTSEPAAARAGEQGTR